MDAIDLERKRDYYEVAREKGRMVGQQVPLRVKEP
jgi:hypothetical protein